MILTYKEQEIQQRDQDNFVSFTQIKNPTNKIKKASDLFSKESLSLVADLDDFYDFVTVLIRGCNSGGKIQVWQGIVTVNMAKVLLSKNTPKNRNKKPKNIKRLKQDMLSGRFLVAQPLMFDRDGNLIDGQNRLQALIESKTSQEMLIVCGYGTTVAEIVDIGAPRDVVDIAHLQGHMFVSQVHKRVLNSIFYAQPNGRVINSNMTVDEKIQYFLRLKEGVDLVLNFPKQSAIVSAAVVRAFYSKKVSKDSLLNFLSCFHLMNPELFNTSGQNPAAALKLKQFFDRKEWRGHVPEGGSAMEYQYYYTQTCLDKFLKNKSGKRVDVIYKELYPVAFLDNR